MPRAVIRACRRPAIKVKGFFLVTTKKSRGRTNRPWMSSPTMTDTVYIPNCPPTRARSFISTIFPAIRKRIPTGAYLLNRGQMWQTFYSNNSSFCIHASINRAFKSKLLWWNLNPKYTKDFHFYIIIITPTPAYDKYFIWKPISTTVEKKYESISHNKKVICKP